LLFSDAIYKKVTYLRPPKARILSLGFHVCFSVPLQYSRASKVTRVSVSELGEVANIANFGGTLSPTPRTFTRRPSRHPNLGLEKGIHILPNRAIGFYYPTSVGNKPHLQPLGVRPRLLVARPDASRTFSASYSATFAHFLHGCKSEPRRRDECSH
jgi:hypothetical protein